ERELEAFGGDRHAVLAGPDGVDRDTVERPTAERFEGRVQLARRPREGASLRQPAEERQRRLLSLRAVDRAEAPGLEPELEQLAQRRGVVTFDASLVDRCDDVRKTRAPLLVP